MNNYPDGVNGSDPYFNQEDEVEIIDPERDAESIKRLAVVQALYKVIASEVKTGDPYNLRGEVDAIMRERFTQAKKLGLAPKSFDIEVDGEKVGTYSITTTKAEPESTYMALQVESQQELIAWAVDNGCVKVDMAKAEAIFADTGEVPRGCVAVPMTKPQVDGGQIAKTTLRIDPAKVAGSLGGDVGDMVLAFLEGGGEDGR